MDLIDLTTPKPNMRNGEFSPTLLRGLNECFKRNAIQFSSLDHGNNENDVPILHENKLVNTPRKTSVLGSKRSSSTPLTPLCTNAVPSKRRVLGHREVTNSIAFDAITVDIIKKPTAPLSNYRKSKSTNAYPSLIEEGHTLGSIDVTISSLCSTLQPDQTLEIEIKKHVVRKQLSYFESVSDFLELEKKFGAYQPSSVA